MLYVGRAFVPLKRLLRHERLELQVKGALRLDSVLWIESVLILVSGSLEGTSEETENPTDS